MKMNPSEKFLMSTAEDDFGEQIDAKGLPDYPVGPHMLPNRQKERSNQWCVPNIPKRFTDPRKNIPENIL